MFLTTVVWFLGKLHTQLVVLLFMPFYLHAFFGNISFVIV